MNSQRRPSIGMEVIDNAGMLVGIVEAVEHGHFVVQKGFFFPTSHRIPDSAIDYLANNEITLRISREMAQSNSVDRNWAEYSGGSEIAAGARETRRRNPGSGGSPQHM